MFSNSKPLIDLQRLAQYALLDLNPDAKARVDLAPKLKGKAIRLKECLDQVVYATLAISDATSSCPTKKCFPGRFTSEFKDLVHLNIQLVELVPAPF